MSFDPGIDEQASCRRCHGPYRYFPKLGYEMCEDCGHIRRNKPIHHPSIQT